MRSVTMFSYATEKTGGKALADIRNPIHEPVKSSKLAAAPSIFSEYAPTTRQSRPLSEASRDPVLLGDVFSAWCEDCPHH